MTIRNLIFENTSRGEWLEDVFKYFLPYFEDLTNEEIQIFKEEEVILLKKDGSREVISDANFFENYLVAVKTYCEMISGLAMDSTISIMLPVNRFRYTNEVNTKSLVKIAIRLNDDELLYTYEDFLLKPEEYNFLINKIAKEKASLCVVGAQGSGKTSFANLFVQEFNQDEIVNVVGDIHDYIFKKEQRYVEINAKSSKDYEERFDALMRSASDRILIPELTMLNALAILRFLNTGNKGLILTMHADYPQVAEAMYQNLLMQKVDISLEQVKESVKHIDFIIYLNKSSKGSRFIEKIEITNPNFKKEFNSLSKETKEINEDESLYNPITEEVLKKMQRDKKKGKSIAFIATKYNTPYQKTRRKLEKTNNF